MKPTTLLRTGAIAGVVVAATTTTPAGTAVAVTVAALAVGGSVLLARPADQPHTGIEGGLADILTASGYTVDPPRPASTEPDFRPITDEIPGRDGRQLHHDVWQVVADPRLQVDLDRVDDAPGFTAEEREWMRRRVLNGTPVEQVVDRGSWTNQHRRKPRPFGGHR